MNTIKRLTSKFQQQWYACVTIIIIIRLSNFHSHLHFSVINHWINRWSHCNENAYSFVLHSHSWCNDVMIYLIITFYHVHLLYLKKNFTISAQIITEKWFYFKCTTFDFYLYFREDAIRRGNDEFTTKF